MRGSPWNLIGSLLGIAGIAVLGVVGSAAGPAARAQQPGPTSPVEELAERLLAMPYPGPTGQQPAPTVQLLPGQVPDALPFTLTLPPGARVVGSMVRSGGPLAGTTVVLDAPGTREDVLGFYERDLEAQGWHAASVGPMPAGGFQVSGPSISRTYCQDSGGPSLSVTVFARTPGPNDVRLSTSASPGPCNVPAPPAGPRSMPMAAMLLPPLTPPPGVELQAGGNNGGGSNRWSSEATAETTRPPSELEAHFAAQLAAAGWTRQSGGADEGLAWSAWALPEEGDWSGLLLVAAWPEADRRLLSVRVESPTQSHYGVGGMTTVGGGPYYTPPPPPPATAPPPSQPGPGGVFPAAPVITPPPLPSGIAPPPPPDLPPPPAGGFVSPPPSPAVAPR
ncbi:MAG TPA: hypothetical protein VK066_27980 [Chloroflexota bacterium]|nr:hypothetical protein [Chloroflexota bacterium]